MADRYWVGGSGTWNSTTTTKWSAASGKSFTGSRTGTALTTVGSPALVAGMTLFNSAGTASGTIVSGSGNSWITSASGTIASSSLTAATIGASVPTAADNVFFDANSNSGTAAFTITMATSPRVCNNLTITTDGVMTLAGTNIGLTVSGSLSFPATNLTRTYTGLTTFNATTTGKTITTNGKTLVGGVTFDGIGGGWTLGSALDCSTGTITATNGTFDTGGYSVNAGALVNGYAGAPTLNLNNSTIQLSNASYALDFTSFGSVTLNAGTSAIRLLNAVNLRTILNFTYYDLFLSSSAGALTSVDIQSGATFSFLSIYANSLTTASFGSNITITYRLQVFKYTLGVSKLTFSGNATINSLQILGDGNYYSSSRIMICSNIIGTQRSLAVTTISALEYADFRDIAITGVAASGTSVGDCKGNSGITFDTPKTVYYALTSGGNWGISGACWSATIGGTPDTTQFPLAQDTVIFPAAYPAAVSVVTINSNYNIGTIDMSARTSNSLAISIPSDISIYGDWTNGIYTYIYTTSFTVTFAGRQTQTLTSAGITFDAYIYISNINNIFRIVGNVNSPSYRIDLSNSTLDLNGYTWYCKDFQSSGATSNLTFNGGTLQFESSFYVTGVLTTTQGSSAGKIVVGDSLGFPSFSGGGNTYNCTLEITYTGPTTIYGSNTFTNITNSVTPCSISFEYQTTNTFTNWNVNGTAGNLVTLDSSDSSTNFTLSKASGIVSSNYLNIKHSDATGGATWYAGVNSIKDGASSGWILTAPPAVSYNANFLQFF